MIRAVIADDEALSRRLVHQMLARHTDVEIVAECADGAATRDAIESLAPDVVFLGNSEGTFTEYDRITENDQP